jgi:hypothetical protein
MCILAALWDVVLGLTKVGNEAKQPEYSEKEKLYFVPV